MFLHGCATCTGTPAHGKFLKYDVEYSSARESLKVERPVEMPTRAHCTMFAREKPVLGGDSIEHRMINEHHKVSQNHCKLFKQSVECEKVFLLLASLRFSVSLNYFAIIILRDTFHSHQKTFTKLI